MNKVPYARRMVWVVNPSKLCNLRCSYCYEWNELGNPARMPTALLRKIFLEIRAYHLELERQHGRAITNISWLGGEPLILPVEYLDEIMALEHEVLGDLLESGAFYNVVQSNLYRVTDETIDFLLRHQWKVGVSLDVIPGARVSVGGRETEARVLENVERLRARGIEPDAIAVLAGHTLPHLSRVYDHFVAHGFKRLRVLPLFSGPPERPVTPIVVSDTEMADALAKLFVHWIGSGAAIEVEPLQQYVVHALRKLLSIRGRLYDRALDGETVLVVNTNGDLYQVVDAYEPSRAMGNLGTQPIGEIMRSVPTLEGLRRDEQLRLSVCGPCEFAGHCNGTPAMDSPRDGTDGGRCLIYYRLHRFMESYLRDARFDDVTLRQLLRWMGGRRNIVAKAASGRSARAAVTENV